MRSVYSFGVVVDHSSGSSTRRSVAWVPGAVPAAVDRQMAHKQSKSAAVTEYKEFPGRSHFTIGQEGWEEVADYALDWATENAADPVAG